jgi:hypothetical protein
MKGSAYVCFVVDCRVEHIRGYKGQQTVEDFRNHSLVNGDVL